MDKLDPAVDGSAVWVHFTIRMDKAQVSAYTYLKSITLGGPSGLHQVIFDLGIREMFREQTGVHSDYLMQSCLENVDAVKARVNRDGNDDLPW